jgi:hypothetical protein
LRAKNQRRPTLAQTAKMGHPEKQRQRHKQIPLRFAPQDDSEGQRERRDDNEGREAVACAEWLVPGEGRAAMTAERERHGAAATPRHKHQGAPARVPVPLTATPLTGNALLPRNGGAVLYFSTCSLQTGFRAGVGRKRGWRTLRVARPGRWVYRRTWWWSWRWSSGKRAHSCSRSPCGR